LFLWNGETSQFLGRTAGSWVRIIGFYFVLYSFLAAFFAAMFMVFLQTLDQAEPKWKQNDGLIGTNPGLGFRPKPSNVESTLIQFQRGEANKPSWVEYTTGLEDFLKPYEKPEAGSHVVNCDFDTSAQTKKENEVCLFKITTLGPEVKKPNTDQDKKCNKEDSFGYSRGNPCIFLKLNKIFGWQPQPYDDIEELKKDNGFNGTVPQSLIKVIEETAKEHPGKKEYLNMVWVECTGVNEVDKENIGENMGDQPGKELKLRYTPYQGFPGYYFPFNKTPGYMSPIVAVQFIDPLPGVLITVECRAYAKNIIYDKQRRLGLVKFELKVGE